LEAVKTLVAETYHIAIDNLCTFLPQDRVGSFSGFDSTMLLKETEKSVSGKQHLYNDHERLIQLESEMLSSDSNLTTAQAELKSLEAEVARLEREKELMEEREDSVKKIRLYEQKFMWVSFDDKRVVAVKLKEERKEVKTKLQNAQAGQAPLQEKIATLIHEYDRGKHRRKDLQNEINKSHKAYHNGVEKANRYQDEVDNLQNDLNAIDAAQRRAEKSVQDKRQKVEEIQAILMEYPSKEEIDRSVSTAQDELRVSKRQLNERKREVEKIHA